MKKFRRSFNGYNINEVNAFIDDVIRQIESMANVLNMIGRFNDYVITMNERQVVDAFNKCPYHSGFDFTFKLSVVDETDIDENYLGESISSLSEGDDLPKNPVTSVGFKLLIVLFAMSLISLVILIVIKNNKRKILFSSK